MAVIPLVPLPGVLSSPLVAPGLPTLEEWMLLPVWEAPECVSLLSDLYLGIQPEMTLLFLFVISFI